MLRKKILSAALPLLLLAACGKAAEGPLPGCAALASCLGAQQDLGADSIALYAGSPDYETCLELYYRLSPGTTEDGAVIQAGDAGAEEIAVFRLPDETQSEAARQALEDYLLRRAEDFVGYAPAQETMVRHGVALRSGRYAAVLICHDPKAAEKRLLAMLSGSEPVPEETIAPYSPAPSPTETAAPQRADGTEPSDVPEPSYTEPESAVWSYDHDAILLAWNSGDESGLDGKNAEILHAVRAILSELTGSGMTDYEKELAVHDFIIRSTQYDHAELEHRPDSAGNPDLDNSNPYGALIRGRAICLGYSSTFQLMMDCLGIECITVHGQGNRTLDEHAWNMVRLDGDWYCVDVTWDDPAGEPQLSILHKYFNVTSDFLRQTRHYWDEETVPEATATVYAYRG